MPIYIYIYIWRRAINPIHGSSRKNKSYGGGKIGKLHSEKPVSRPEKAGTAVGGVIAFVAGARPTKDLAHVAAPVGISVGMPGPRRLRDGAFKIAFSAFGKGLPSPKKNDFGFVRLQFVTFSKDILLDVFLAAKLLMFCFPHIYDVLLCLGQVIFWGTIKMDTYGMQVRELCARRAP